MAVATELPWRLFVLRHGEAESHAADDTARRLTERGRARLRGVVRANAAALAEAQTLWTSPLVRAHQSAEVVAEVVGPHARRESALLRPEASVNALMDELAAAEESPLILVSHQPLVGDLVSTLCGLPPGHYQIPTAGLAQLELEYPCAGAGRLLWLR